MLGMEKRSAHPQPWDRAGSTATDIIFIIESRFSNFSKVALVAESNWVCEIEWECVWPGRKEKKFDGTAQSDYIISFSLKSQNFSLFLYVFIIKCLLPSLQIQLKPEKDRGWLILWLYITQFEKQGGYLVRVWKAWVGNLITRTLVVKIWLL